MEFRGFPWNPMDSMESMESMDSMDSMGSMEFLNKRLEFLTKITPWEFTPNSCVFLDRLKAQGQNNNQTDQIKI